MSLCGKCIKVIDSDITENTYWSKCYSYVVTTFVYIENNATLCIEEGTKVYLLNSFVESKEGGGLFFRNGTKLYAGNLCIQAVELLDDCYVISTKIEGEFLVNSGITFNGNYDENDDLESSDLEESQITRENIKEMSKREKCDYRKKCYRKRCRLNKNSSTQSLFKFKSLTLKYVQGLNLYNLNNSMFCGKNVYILNGINAIYNNPLTMINSDISLCNLTIKNTTSYTQTNSFGIGYESSKLFIKNSLNVYKGNCVIENNGETNEYFLILNKCCKLNIVVSSFGFSFGSSTTTIQEPKYIVPNLNDTPFVENLCVISRVSLNAFNNSF